VDTHLFCSVQKRSGENEKRESAKNKKQNKRVARGAWRVARAWRARGA
jgi:hypothetical protein